MALDRGYRDTHYMLGRLVAVVETMAPSAGPGFAGRVYDCAVAALPPWVQTAMTKGGHPLLRELNGLTELTMKGSRLPSRCIGNTMGGMRYWLGYEHEKSYLHKTYPGLGARVETEVTHHVPEAVSVSDGGVKPIAELRR